MSDIAKTLEGRNHTHGDFTHQAMIAESLQEDMRCRDGWGSLSDVQKQALVMIQHKVARIIAGNPNERDHWHDIQGYAKLAEDRCG